MKAITEQNPWGWLICKGIKPIENRTWKCPQKYIGQRVLIHSGAKLDSRHRNMSDLFTPEQWKSLDDETQKIMVGGYLPESAIIGSVEITDCVINHPSIWAEQNSGYSQNRLFWPNGLPCGSGLKGTIYNWVLANPILFPMPIPAKCKLSFWDYPDIQAGMGEFGHEICMCQLSVEEEDQVMNLGGGDYRCRYCGGIWYK